MIVNKKVRLTLVGLNSNAFTLMGEFAAAARRQGWTRTEINLVFDAARAGDYDNLLRVLMEHCEDEEDGEEERDDDECDLTR